MEVRVRKELNIHRQPIVLPQQHSTTLSCAGEVAENRKCELSEGGTRLDHAQEQRYYARLRGLLLSTLVQPTEVVARLEYVIRHFLTRVSDVSAGKGSNSELRFQRHTALWRPELCSPRIRVNISMALAFCRTSSNVAFMDRCLIALSMWTRYSGSRSSHARNNPKILTATC